MGSQSARRKAATGTTPDAVTRPPIWTEGRQRPKFDPRSFASVATAIAKRDLVPAMDDAAARLAVLGHKVSTGDLRVSGRWALRILPSHQRVGAAVLALHCCFVTARALILQPQPPAQMSPLPCPVDRPSGQVEPTLHAIRSAIVLPVHDFTAGRSSPTFPMQFAPNPGWAGAVAAYLLLAILMLFAWPGGAASALLYHLNGGDLRDWF